MAQEQILVVDDEPDIRSLVSEILVDEGYRVTSAENGEAARLAYARKQPDLVLLDIWMPDVDGITLLQEWSGNGNLACPVVMMSGHGTLETAVEATRLGALDFIQKPLSLAKLLATVRQALQAGGKPHAAPRQAAPRQAAQLLGNSPQMQLLRQRAHQAARHDTPVLITGETGSGKQTLAAYIHGLEGHERAMNILDYCRLRGPGAPSYLLGEHDGDEHQRGLFGQARGGTLFVPEIQNLDTGVQELLNMALESGRYTPVGGRQSTELKLRLIAATSLNLERLVREGSFLDQLYYRINVLGLEVPPLRTRPEDIPELVSFFAEWFPNHEGLPYRQFSISALNRLRNHSWPGNVRELRNLVQNLLILGVEGEVSAREVEDILLRNAAETTAVPAARPGSFDLPLREAREQFEREYLSYQLKKAGGSVGKLSESVGMERTHLYRKLRTLGIDPKSVSRTGGSN